MKSSAEDSMPMWEYSRYNAVLSSLPFSLINTFNNFSIDSHFKFTVTLIAFAICLILYLSKMLYFDPNAFYSILTVTSKRSRNTALATAFDSKKNVSLVMVPRDTSDNNQLWQFQPIKDTEGG